MPGPLPESVARTNRTSHHTIFFSICARKDNTDNDLFTQLTGCANASHVATVHRDTIF